MNRATMLKALVAGAVIGVVLTLSLLSLQPARVLATGPEAGRYQISAWASYAGERVHHSGYYILDTVTGKVVDKGHEIHGIDTGTHPATQ